MTGDKAWRHESWEAGRLEGWEAGKPGGREARKLGAPNIPILGLIASKHHSFLACRPPRFLASQLHCFQAS